jgi:hypothetical protein
VLILIPKACSNSKESFLKIKKRPKCKLKTLLFKFGVYLALIYHLEQMRATLNSTCNPLIERTQPTSGDTLLRLLRRGALYLPSAHVHVYFGGAFAAHFYDYLLLLRLRARAVAQRTNFAALMHTIGIGVCLSAALAN